MSRRDIAEQRTSTLQQILSLSIEAAQHNLDFVTSHTEPLTTRLPQLEAAASELVQAIDRHNMLTQKRKELQKNSNGNQDKEAIQQRFVESQKRVEECERRFKEIERGVMSELGEVEEASKAATALIERIRPAFDASVAAIKATIRIAQRDAAS